MPYIILIALVVAADQVIKLAVAGGLGLYGEIQVIPGFFYIHYIQNDGIAFGMLAGKQWVVVIITAALMIGIGVYIFLKRKTEKPAVLFTLSAIVAGGIGNLIDRVRLGYVVDYMDFRVWNYIFNFADIFVVVGCFLLVFLLLTDKEDK